ncbi:D-Ala-D-Ala carboxypeptidase family metallohydrolase [Prevotella amnii]|jgi:peptidase M15|uniref:Peptidase M15 n=2 Tax=Prevotella amnii TaxID=419005 RepID=A0A096CAE4_9BACT|nr:D-Ala-D-Ala carboxypeptidase family metallohydrolase [Prevotella amnii]KGF51897.1 peptidase M15 [Prevotella amnii DNF00058]KXB77725.1 peptidase M15 [Prevotella amnii]
MNLLEQLSPHFSLGEMLQSGVAIRFGINNEPEDVENTNVTAADVRRNLRNLCKMVLEPLRQRVGRIIITSGYRNKELNALVNGVPDSQHVFGEAADIYVSDAAQCAKYADIIMRYTDFDQLIFEPLNSKTKHWLHVSFSRRHKNRREVIGL